ncbi:unnamed protein product [Ostreobium quekettii]|uniref:Uncharacterized protein n=1 Tax=Ostreobium quekettii TaxID=121088 RepID=A0A8S1J3X7_9CHLO|nr:unnamed protein product [Ostreobium quekettii]
MKGSDSGERRAGGPGGPGRGRCATPDSATSNRCEDGRARAPCSGAQRGGSKRQRLSRCAESGSARSDASANAARREAGGGEGPSPWQELPFGALQMIMDELLRMEDGEAWVRRCGCVCRGWRGVSAELLMTDTAASRPPRWAGGRVRLPPTCFRCASRPARWKPLPGAAPFLPMWPRYRCSRHRTRTAGAGAGRSARGDLAAG